MTIHRLCVIIPIMKLSKFSLFFGAYIIVSASFAQQVWITLKDYLGINALSLSFIFLCLLAFFAIIYKSIKTGINFKRVALICAVYLFAFWFAWRQPYAAEKTHVLEYGALAWLSMRDASSNNPKGLKGILYAFIFVLIIGILDEGFQKLLPWRVFEVRDIATNIVSGILGIILYRIAQK